MTHPRHNPTTSPYARAFGGWYKPRRWGVSDTLRVAILAWLIGLMSITAAFAISTEPEASEPPLSSAEAEQLESEGYGSGFIQNIRDNAEERREHRRLHPIRPAENIAKATGNFASGAKWIGIACLSTCATLVLLIVWACMRRNSVVIYRPPGGP